MDCKDLPKLLIITGPTGSGKSSFALEVARSIQGAVVSADSMQVYKYLDIGTAKLLPAEQAGIPHHCLDLVFPDSPFNAGLYKQHADEAIKTIYERGKFPIVVGGTGLYIKVLIHGLFDSPIISEDLRKGLQEKYSNEGLSRLYAELRKRDPDYAATISPNDKQRILRALEIIEATGVEVSHKRDNHRFQGRDYQTLKIGLTLPRPVLYQRINARVEQMIDKGLVTEVKGLMEMGYPPQLKPLQSIGYKEIGQYLSGQIDLIGAIDRIKQETRKYAKRQITWLNGDSEIHSLESTDLEKAQALIKEFIDG